MTTFSDHAQEVDQSWLGLKTHSGFKFRISGSGLQVSSSGFGCRDEERRPMRISSFGFQVPGFELRFQGVGCRVKGVGCRVHGVGSRVWGVGCRELGLGCGGSGSGK